MSAFTHRIRIGLAGVILAALPGLAAAQPLAAPPAHKGRMFDKCDRDQNGVLDKGEKREMRALRKAHLLKKFDANGNGVLDPAERAEAIRVKIDKMVARLDTDGSGAISRREASVRPMLAKQFQTIDGNGDGVVTRRELAASKIVKLNGGHKRGKGKRFGHRQPV